MDNTSYKTKQREALLDFFKRNKDKCFLAKDIIKHSEDNVNQYSGIKYPRKTPGGIFRGFDPVIVCE